MGVKINCTHISGHGFSLCAKGLILIETTESLFHGL